MVGNRKEQTKWAGPGVIIIVKPPILTNQQLCGSPSAPRGPSIGADMTMLGAVWRGWEKGESVPFGLHVLW